MFNPWCYLIAAFLWFVAAGIDAFRGNFVLTTLNLLCGTGILLLSLAEWKRNP